MGAFGKEREEGGGEGEGGSGGFGNGVDADIVDQQEAAGDCSEGEEGVGGTGLKVGHGIALPANLLVAVDLLVVGAADR